MKQLLLNLQTYKLYSQLDVILEFLTVYNGWSMIREILTSLLFPVRPRSSSSEGQDPPTICSGRKH